MHELRVSSWRASSELASDAGPGCRDAYVALRLPCQQSCSSAALIIISAFLIMSALPAATYAAITVHRPPEDTTCQQPQGNERHPLQPLPSDDTHGSLSVSLSLSLSLSLSHPHTPTHTHTHTHTHMHARTHAHTHTHLTQDVRYKTEGENALQQLMEFTRSNDGWKYERIVVSAWMAAHSPHGPVLWTSWGWWVGL